ncbi:DnaD domain-containing protein [Enterococcus italicus]|uniref:DnaD domain-containing protein n=1 Tax=Enterococcus italicus TaxID=246144 RepID=UPI002074927A|nr:DnaD domain protein [Enterococcus italicus]
MDYIRQINAFENWNEFNEIGPGAQLLWYKLMRVANLSGWQNELSISNTRLQSMTKSTEKTLINNRNQLIQNGLLQYKKRGRTKAGIYILTDLSTGNIPVKEKELSSTVKIPVVSTVIPTVDSTVDCSVDSTVDTSAYINKTKLNETKQKDINNTIEDDKRIIFEEYSKKIIPMDNPIQIDRVQSFVEDEFSLDVVLYAIDYAHQEKKKSANYIVKVLNGWKKSGVETVEDAKKAVEQFKNSFKSSYQKQPTRAEALPSWYGKEQPMGDEKEIQLDADIEARFEAYQARKAAKDEANDTDAS